MKNQYSGIDYSGFTNAQLHKDGYRERRQLEIKRRFSILQHKRGQLERELRAIKTMLFALDKQIQSFSDYEQLSIES